jgi:ABC-type phosphate/phosphonate transport system substrate-binding protein
VRFTCRTLPVCMIALVLGISSSAPEAPAGSAALRIGVPLTFFHDMGTPLIQTYTEPFMKVMHESTGLTGDLTVAGGPLTVARQLNDDKLQLGVFHGFEYAWAHQKHPDLKPLMLAVDAKHEQRAFVLVRKDSSVTTFADLKGKQIALPRRSREYSRLFLERISSEAGGPKQFFKSVTSPNTVEVALDELAQKKVDAAVVDTYGLEFYKDLRPGVFARLRTVAESEPIPPTVIAYRPGALPEATLAKIREGLSTARKSEAGRDMLKMWKMTNFETVPGNFEQTLAAALKAFPAPEVKQ